LTTNILSVFSEVFDVKENIRKIAETFDYYYVPNINNELNLL